MHNSKNDLTLCSNYYVFETTLKDNSEPEPEEGAPPEEEDEDGKKKPKFGRPEEKIPPEEPGIGCNQCTYFVCSRLGDPFYRLPNVTPLQITTARQIKKLLTGRLDV